MKIEIVLHDPTWPLLFNERAQRLRSALGSIAVRIDHIGSTSIPGLAAKPIIDIQVSVASFEPIDAYCVPLETIGYIFRASNPERTKRYFREAPGERREHVHVRQVGSWAEQFALLFRDYMRGHVEEAQQYARIKQRLATQFPDDGRAYTEAKNPFIWEVMRRADNWSQKIGWEPPPSDW